MNTKTISISIFKLVLPLFVILFVQFAAHAQTGLEGTWTVYYRDGTKAPKPVTVRYLWKGSINTHDHTLEIVNGEGKSGEGLYDGKGFFHVNSKSLGLFVTGTISEDQTSISWTDGTTWKREFLNLRGTWTGYFGQGNLRPAPKPGTITQKGATLTIDNGEGSKSNGRLSGTTITATEWGITGIVSEDGTKISWSNNTHWRKNNQSIENTPTKTALSANDMNLVMSWIAAQVSSQRLPFCYRQSFTRDAGEPASTCANGWEKVGLRCQPKCVAGYERSGTHCRAVCPQGFTDIGSYCQKPAAYGRGAGYAWKFGDKAFSLDAARERCTKDNPQGCEQNGAIFYPKCKPGFHNVGANICSPNCPYSWQDTGTGCYKPATPANLSGDPLGCKPGMEGKDGLCYNKCNKTDYSGVGPVCWQNCPSQMPVNCGAGCATTSKDCALAVTDMVISPIMAAISLATLGGASGVTVSGNTIKGGTTTAATKAPGIIAKMKAIYAKIDLEVKAIKLTNNAYKTSSAIVSERDLVLKEFSENFAEMTSYEINKTLEERLHPKELEEVRLEWAKRHFYLMGQTNADVTLRNALTVASVVDPTGLLAVEKAFYHPVCKNSTPFPTITHNPFLK